MRKFWNSMRRLMPIPMLAGCALGLTACGASTGAVRADLDTPALAALRSQVVKSCSNIPRAWPADALATQAKTEQYVNRDGADTEACASSALRYVNRTEARDRDLTKSIKK